jgi:hypothetical protein
MIKMVKVVDVKPLGGSRLRIRFSDGNEGEHDFSGLLAEGGEMVEPLRDAAFFKQVHVEYGVLTWQNGFDLDSIALHMSMEEAGELHAPASAK